MGPGWPSEKSHAYGIDYQESEVPGLANDTVTARLSKSLDMRFHWIKDRVRQGQFQIFHIPGIANIADFLTKALLLSRHNALAPFLALDPADDVDTLVRANIKLSSMLFA